MHPQIHQMRVALAEVCRRRFVRSLSIFGSATNTPSDVAPRDLDFLVEFEAIGGATRVDAYFGLKEDLEAMFAMPVDLVEAGAFRNPHLRAAVENSKRLLYAAV